MEFVSSTQSEIEEAETGSHVWFKTEATTTTTTEEEEDLGENGEQIEQTDEATNRRIEFGR